MKYTFFALTALLAWACGAPQEPQVPVSTSTTTLIVTGSPVPVPTEPIPNNPDPLPTPVSSAPVPSDSSQPTPPPAALTASAARPIAARSSSASKKYTSDIGPGYTVEQIGQGYCSTNGTNCASAAPSPESLGDTLFVCICPAGQKEGSIIELLCACQSRCKNDKPDFIARCDTPCNLGCASTAPSALSSAPASSAAPVPLPVPLLVEPAPVQNQPIPPVAPLAKKRA